MTTPLAVLTFWFLAAARGIRVALGWALLFAACLVMVGLLKLLHAVCGQAVAVLPNASGHTALSAVVYGSLCLLIAGNLALPARRMVCIAGSLLVTAIAASRVALGYHTPAELGFGLIIGIGAVAAFRWMLSGQPPAALPAQRLLGAIAVITTLMHGVRWPSERALQHLAHLARLFGVPCA